MPDCFAQNTVISLAFLVPVSCVPNAGYFNILLLTFFLIVAVFGQRNLPILLPKHGILVFV
jgi:hypothetical protein